MKKALLRNSAILLIPLIALLGSAKNDPDKMILPEKALFRSQDKIKLENIINIGSEDIDKDDYFSMIVNLRIDDKNNIYVLDRREFSIKIFSLDGSLIGKIDLPKGQGPGDFIYPRGMAVDHDRILIGDEDTMRVSIMDSTGKYLSSIKVDEEPGKIEIQVCSLDGQVEMRLSRIHEDYKKKLERDPVTNSYRFSIGTAHTLATQSGHIINILKQIDYDKSHRGIYSIFDIFDPNGKWLASFPSTDIGQEYVRLADINQNDLLIVDSVEPSPRVRVFSLKIL